MNLKLIPPPDETPTLVERLGDRLSESAKSGLSGSVLLVVPLGVYNYAVVLGYQRRYTGALERD